jgi:sulfur carrier protein ThiS
MADINKTFGVKVPELLHSEATELMKKLDLSGEGFLTELVNVYKSEKAKEDVPIIAEDLRDLQALSQRISGIYLNMAYKIENINKASEQNKQEELTKRDSTISDLQYKNSELNKSVEVLEGVFNATCEDKNILTETVNQLTNSIKDKNLIVDEYKSKNDMLLGDLSDYKQYKTQLEEYKKLLADAQARNIDKENIIKDNDYSINRLTTDLKTKYDAIEDLKIKHGLDLEILKKDNQKELDQLKKENELNIKLAAADIKEDLNNKFNQEQLKHNKEVEIYQSKYKALLEELELSRRPIAKAKETNPNKTVK